MTKPRTPRYVAEVGGNAWKRGPVATFDTITAARAWAEEYGMTADICTIWHKSGRVVASHRRYGSRWRRVTPPTAQWQREAPPT